MLPGTLLALAGPKHWSLLLSVQTVETAPLARASLLVYLLPAPHSFGIWQINVWKRKPTRHLKLPSISNFVSLAQRESIFLCPQQQRRLDQVWTHGSAPRSQKGPRRSCSWLSVIPPSLESGSSRLHGVSRLLRISTAVFSIFYKAALLTRGRSGRLLKTAPSCPELLSHFLTKN